MAIFLCPISRNTYVLKGVAAGFSHFNTLLHFCSSLDSPFSSVHLHFNTQAHKGRKTKTDAQMQGLSGHKLAIEAFRLGKQSFPVKLVRLWSSLPRRAIEMIQLDMRQHWARLWSGLDNRGLCLMSWVVLTIWCSSDRTKKVTLKSDHLQNIFWSALVYLGFELFLLLNQRVYLSSF